MSKSRLVLARASVSVCVALIVGPATSVAVAQVHSGTPELDRSRPVPERSAILKAWQQRQESIRTFQFTWTEQQLHPKGWMPNPRYRQAEWSNTPALLVDREYTVAKTLAVDGIRMHYSYEMERKAEPDGVRVGTTQTSVPGLGEGKHYRYTSDFDGASGRATLESLAGNSPPPTSHRISSNVDAQNLDVRAILLTFRPLDEVMGHLLIERAVTNQVRTIHRGKSTFLLEEQRDPSGWKAILRIEPERSFSVVQLLLPFEQKPTLEMDIDYLADAKWGWIPSGWRVTQLLADGSRRQVVDAKVTSYTINEPIKFR